ncbi:MAG: cyclase [Leifsonia xyli]|nr:MAG: cyclase [Leifsonia xyli]
MTSTFTLITECPSETAIMFDISLDIDAHIASMSRSQERAISGVTAGRIGLGQSVTWRARHFGIWFTMTSKITALDRPHRFVDAQVQGPFRTFIHEHRFEDTPLGCRMTDTITVSSPIFGMVAERLVLVPYLRRLIRQRNVTLVNAVG